MPGCLTATRFHPAILSERRGVIHGRKEDSADLTAPEARLGGKAQREAKWLLAPSVVGAKEVLRSQVDQGGVKLRLSVKNQGGKAGSQSVAACLRYVDVEGGRTEDGGGDSSTSGPRQPVFYTKVRDCAPGEEANLEFRIKARQFSRLSWELWEKAGTHPGEYDVIVTAGDVTATERFRVVP